MRIKIHSLPIGQKNFAKSYFQNLRCRYVNVTCMHIIAVDCYLTVIYLNDVGLCVNESMCILIKFQCT